jgi:methanogenic corrinoid protein MtbC1
VIEGQVIPRLIRAHTDHLSHDEAALSEPATLQVAQDALQEAVLSGSLKAMTDLLDEIELGGPAPESVLTTLIGPTAWRLVDLWREDRVSHVDVTIGLGRLKQLARGLSEPSIYNGDNNPGAGSVFIAPRPGEDQTFGLYLMGEMFRWSGWRATSEAAASNDDICRTVREDWYDVLCLNAAREGRMDDLRLTLDLARAESCNQKLRVLVSGQVFEDRPTLIDEVGADAAVADAADALSLLGGSAGRRVAA